MKNAASAATQADLDAALEACDAAVNEDPDNGNIYYYRGFNLLYLDRFTDAEDDFTKAISLGTSYPARSYFQRGVCKENQQRLRDASEDFKKALEINPEWGAAQRKVDEYHWAYQ